jgi:hypothetical protein
VVEGLSRTSVDRERGSRKRPGASEMRIFCIRRFDGGQLSNAGDARHIIPVI